MSRRAIVIGAGAVGLFTAWELNRAGWRVVVCERAAAPAEASWAGGGILMSLEPGAHPAGLDPLLKASREAYPACMARIARSSGIDPEYLISGALVVGDGCDALEEWARRESEPWKKLDRAALRRIEPGIGDVEAGVLLPDVAQVRNPRLLKALISCLMAAGVEFRFDSPVQGIETRAGRATGVRTVQGFIGAELLVIAAGAWSGEFAAACGFALPVRPVKGQMLLLRPAHRLLKHVAVGDDVYLVPRKDGLVLVGATVEEAGFDRTPTAAGAEALLDAARRLLPAIGKARLERHWAGLRPGSADGLPYIGRAPGFENLFVNSGHFRLGLTLGPGSAALLTDLIEERQPEVDPAPFRLERI